MTTLNEHMRESLKDAEFKKEYDALAVEYEIKQAIIDARKEKTLTQKQLSGLTGINQSEISKMENGSILPTIGMLQKIAQALGKELHVEFK